MGKRVRVIGRLCVFRQECKEYLEADLYTMGRRIYYPRCPKCFDDLITNPIDNVKWIEVSIDKDGANPRVPVILDDSLDIEY